MLSILNLKTAETHTWLVTSKCTSGFVFQCQETQKQVFPLWKLSSMSSMFFDVMINPLVPLWCIANKTSRIWLKLYYKRFCHIWVIAHPWLCTSCGCFPHACFNYSTVFDSSAQSRRLLTYWGRDKMDAISQTTFSNAFSLMKMHEFRLRFHWSLFLKFELTIFQHLSRKWLGAGQATSHYLNKWWLVYLHIYVSLGLNELWTADSDW